MKPNIGAVDLELHPRLFQLALLRAMDVVMKNYIRNIASNSMTQYETGFGWEKKKWMDASTRAHSHRHLDDGSTVIHTSSNMHRLALRCHAIFI